MCYMLPIYDVVFDEDDTSQGLFAVSFVDKPAINVDFIAMRKQSKDAVPMYFAKTKHEIVSPILIPNQLIYRRGEGKDSEGYYIRWTEDTIQQAAFNMIEHQRLNWVTEMHPMQSDPTLKYDDCLLDNVYMLRLWIVDDPNTDDANVKYGFKNLPKGTLMAHYKVNNRALWQKIVNKELKGLSVECVAKILPFNRK